MTKATLKAELENGIEEAKAAYAMCCDGSHDYYRGKRDAFQYLLKWIDTQPDETSDYVRGWNDAVADDIESGQD